MFTSDKRFGDLFEEASKLGPNAVALIANYIASDIAGLVAKNGDNNLSHITGAGLSALMARVAKNEISSRGAKDALTDVFMNGGDLQKILSKYVQQSDAGALEAIARKIVGDYPQVAQDYKNGKESALQFLIGQGMRQTKGSANPELLKAAILAALT